MLPALLICAASLKIHDLIFSPLPASTLFLSSSQSLAIAEVELLLAVWLLSEWLRKGAWIISIGSFAIFSLANLYLALEGQASCGCFGQVRFSPWLMLAIDLSVIATLAFARPVECPDGSGASWKTALTTGIAVVLVLGSIWLVLLYFFVDSAAALAFLRDEPVTVSPATLDAGESPTGEWRQLRLEIRNRSDRPVKIVGGTSTCACISTDDLPVMLEPASSQIINIRVQFTGSAGLFIQRLSLYSDHPDQPTLFARFRGRVCKG